DFRRWITALAGLALFAGLASAQVGGGGGTQLTCSVNTSNTPTLRSEGITELVGDIVITCTGGQIIPNIGNGGATSNPAAQAVNITVSLTSQVTSRLLGSGNVSEALLMIDEPNSGLAAPIPGFGPAEPFTVCSAPTTGGCAGPSSGSGNAYVLTQTVGTTAYQTAVSSSTATAGTASPVPNVYQGVVAGNQVTFFGVPVVPPGTSGSRVFRITNVRVNANGLGGGGSVPVQASLQTSNPAALPISNATPIVGFVQQSLTTSSTAGAFTQCVGTSLSPGLLAQASVVSFSEAGTFASAFKTRVDPTVSGQSGSSSPGQGSSLVQNVPGHIYNAESGFTLTVNGATAGLADFGTRFQAVLNNIPTGAGVHVYISSTNLLPTATPSGTIYVTPATSSNVAYATAVTSSTAAEGSAPTASSASAGFNGSVPVVEITPTTGNSATAVWEVINTQPSVIDTYYFGIYYTYSASPGTNVPPAGTATVNLSYSPTSTTTTASSGPIPRFIDTSKAGNAFSVSICRTVLLFPFVTNQAGFDTGLAISNTSTDPFGTSPQQGTCQMSWYGSAAPTTPPTPSIATATTYANLASSLAPGFQGYMIAVCNFQYAHGFAFISDVGARNLAMGYLALIIPDPAVTIKRQANPFPLSGPVTGEQLGY
ncbi:MAG: hypothetical protein JO323_12015, partial [Acidobacteriia bacterium]|nr:hypothetical protein [Terriglobia bacterium]